MRCRLPSAALVGLAALGAPVFGQAESAPPQPERAILEHYPADVQAALEVRDRHLKALLESQGGTSPGLDFVLAHTRRWEPGSTVTVAFRGGSPQLHAEIAAVARSWCEHGNLILDFGLDPATSLARTWSESDTVYAADIRVSFNSRGYWSLIGADSRAPSIAGPGAASLNLSGFHIMRPRNWKAVVLHEFGHALGFQHEHQNPKGHCATEFRWEDDPGYVPTRNLASEFVADSEGRRPGIYTVLAGPPNRWNRAKVDWNLRELTPAPGLVVSAHDRHSIMHYAFGSWMFKSGEDSPCFIQPNQTLSNGDKAGMRVLYPLADDLGALDQIDKARVAHQALLGLDMGGVDRDYFESRLEGFNTLRRQ